MANVFLYHSLWKETSGLVDCNERKLICLLLILFCLLNGGFIVLFCFFLLFFPFWRQGPACVSQHNSPEIVSMSCCSLKILGGGGDCRDGSEVKNAYCSSRGLTFDSRHPHSSSLCNSSARRSSVVF